MPKRIFRRSTGGFWGRHFARCNLGCKLAPRQPSLASRDRGVSRRVPPTPPIFVAVLLPAARRNAPAPVLIAANRAIFQASRFRRPSMVRPRASTSLAARHPESRALISWRSKEPPPSQCSLPVIRIRLRTIKPRAPVLLVARAPVGGNLSRSNDMRDGGCSRRCKGEPLARKFPRRNVLASRQRCDPG